MASSGSSPSLRTPEQVADIVSILFVVPIITFSILLFTYGFYVLLFLSSLYVLNINKRDRAHQIFHIVSTSFLFLLVTALVLCRLISEGTALTHLWTTILLPTTPPDVDLSLKFQDAGQWLFTFTNTVAEIILIHRTYVVWGSGIKIIVVPTLLMLANLGTGITSHFVHATVTQNTSNGLKDTHGILFSGVFMGVNALTNVTLTGMIAGRIWYISRQTREVFGTDAVRKYSSIIAIIVESGVLYPTFLIVFIILSFATFPVESRLPIAHSSAIISDLLGLIAAIAPTLIIVRSGLGLTIEKRTTSSSMQLSTFRAEPTPKGSRNSEGFLLVNTNTNRQPAIASTIPSLYSEAEGPTTDYLGVPIRGDGRFEFNYHYRKSTAFL